VSYRARLPQIATQRPFITDGGMETTLVFRHGIDLPYFAASELLNDDAGVELLRRYFEPYLALARGHDTGMVLDAPTWRANRDWGAKLGYSSAGLADVNRRAVALVTDIRAAHHDGPPIVVSGLIGPRGDGYVAGRQMTTAEAERYHSEQIATLAETDVDMVAAMTLTYADEAIGVARAARARDLPVVISFTLETDGRLPSGQPLGEAIDVVDAATEASPAYFMINCAHPAHFEGVLREGGDWMGRLCGIRANASSKSHGELDEADELDDGDPRELGIQYGKLRTLLPNVWVLGGCCGTDDRHVAEICSVCLAGDAVA
jgi:homocysteine S-methyltransferase